MVVDRDAPASRGRPEPPGSRRGSRTTSRHMAGSATADRGRMLSLLISADPGKLQQRRDQFFSQVPTRPCAASTAHAEAAQSSPPRLHESARRSPPMPGIPHRAVKALQRPSRPPRAAQDRTSRTDRAVDDTARELIGQPFSARRRRSWQGGRGRAPRQDRRPCAGPKPPSTCRLGEVPDGSGRKRPRTGPDVVVLRPVPRPSVVPRTRPADHEGEALDDVAPCAPQTGNVADRREQIGDALAGRPR